MTRAKVNTADTSKTWGVKDMPPPMEVHLETFPGRVAFIRNRHSFPAYTNGMPEGGNIVVRDGRVVSGTLQFHVWIGEKMTDAYSIEAKDVSFTFFNPSKSASATPSDGEFRLYKTWRLPLRLWWFTTQFLMATCVLSVGLNLDATAETSIHNLHALCSFAVNNAKHLSRQQIVCDPDGGWERDWRWAWM